jgi:Bromodomain extra-terminal - transcription regulation
MWILSEVVQNRKMSKEEKLMLTANLGKLSVEDVNNAVEIGAKYDPNLDTSSSDVDIDFDSMVLALSLSCSPSSGSY